ncbi:hypothetical protein RND81_14G214400 [Saponaria officinalis]|uniref:Uncharacterized protein n=1 Tax=Saponaria officinalis TaxID=3572 RepID=A0AAW1GSW3_SAPOF
MEFHHHFPFLLISLALVVPIYGQLDAVVVTGSVFYDRCTDGELSVNDYPLSGMSVQIWCPASSGSGIKYQLIATESTNELGIYTITRPRDSNFSSGCYAKLLSSHSSGISCTHTYLRLLTATVFDTYYTDPILCQPPRQQYPSFCPSTPPSRPPVPPAVPSPALTFPGLPPMPFRLLSPYENDTFCPFYYWIKPQYWCHWRSLQPNTSVSYVLGPLSITKFGNNISLKRALMGRGDPYRALLRETVTYLLNIYNSFANAQYAIYDVSNLFNHALVSNSTHKVLRIAENLKRANSGARTHIPCKLTPCYLN